MPQPGEAVALLQIHRDRGVLESHQETSEVRSFAQPPGFIQKLRSLRTVHRYVRGVRLPNSNSRNDNQTLTTGFIFSDVRLAALEALVDYTKVDGKWSDLEFLLNMAETDPDPFMKHNLLQLLIENPPFLRAHHHILDREELVEKLWNIIKYVRIGIIGIEFDWSIHT